MAKKVIDPVSEDCKMLGIGQVKSVGNEVYLEGMANKYVVDRGNEIIEKTAWDIENFKKNPVILFNHGFDPMLGGTPIGKALKVEAREDGLYIKAQLSSVDDPVINRIRGLVKERMLKAFSVGFQSLDSDMDAKGGVKRITKAELYEVSIVGVPMNQDSLFELSAKSLSSKSMDQLKMDVFKAKGALVAEAAHEALLQKIEDGSDKDVLMEELTELMEVEEDELLEILAGNVTPVPESFLVAASEVLGLDYEELKEMAKKENEDFESESERFEKDKEAEKERLKEKEKLEKIKEDGQDLGERQKDFQACVMDKIPLLLEEGKDQEQAIAIAIAKCRELKSYGKVSKKMFQIFFDYAEVCVKQGKKPVESKAKGCDSCSNTKQAEQETVDTPTTPVAAANTEIENNDIGNPMLDQQKQTNILLGAMISALQKISDILEQDQKKEEIEEDESPAEQSELAVEASDEEKAMSQKLDDFNKRLENVKKRLETLSI